MTAAADPAPPRATIAPTLLVVTVMVVAAAALFWRSAGLNPVVMADEWSYSLFARLRDRSESTLPSYLFLALFGMTKQCGSAFLDCARAINACLFAASVPFVYGIARRFVRPIAAVGLAAAAVALPTSSYATYFMPEALYYFGFTVLAWYVIACPPARGLSAGVGAGLVMGTMALAKVHALFLLPGYGAYLLLTWWSNRREQRFGTAAQTFALAVLTVFVVRIVGGYLLAGTSALHLLGRAYAPFAADAMHVQLVPLLAQRSALALLGHLVALASMFALPLALLVSCVCALRARPASHAQTVERAAQALALEGAAQAVARARERLCLFALAMLVPLILITAAFTAVVADAGANESIGRLHARYYSFVFPLLVILPAVALRTRLLTPLRASTVQVAVAAVIAALALASPLLMPAWYQPNFVDSPELAGITLKRSIFAIAVGLDVLLLVLWLRRPRWAIVGFYCVSVPLLVAAGNGAVNASLRGAAVDSPYELGGKLARLYLGDAVSQVLVVGDDVPGLFQARFQLDDPQALTHVLAPGAPVDASMLAPQTRWVLTIGDHALQMPAERALSTGSAALYRLGTDVTIDLTSSSWPALARPPRGLSVRESFGRWSDGASVDFLLASRLPSHARVIVEGAAFGPNAGLPFTLEAGGARATFTLGPTAGRATIDIPQASDDARLTIGIPRPTSPQELGLGNDSRRLGLSLSRIVIQDLGAGPR